MANIIVENAMANTAYKSKIVGNKHPNNLGYNEVIRIKQEEHAIWYKGNSDKILDFYTDRAGIKSTKIKDFQNSIDYFWNVVAKEPQVKCTHSGMPKIIINTLVNVLGKPDILATRDNVVNGEIEEKEDVATNEAFKEIIESNDFYTVLKQDQEPYTMVIGDGVWLINIDLNIDDENPILEFVDGRNVEFERKANRIVSVIVRKYFLNGYKGYMLTDKRSTKKVKDPITNKTKKIATVEYHLYELNNPTSTEVKQEVPLDTIPETKNLESLEFHDFDFMLAVPTMYRYDKELERGESFFVGKLDLFDDLDQSKSQKSNVTRMSTPIDYVPEEAIDYDENGIPKKPTRFDRRYIVLKTSQNSVGQRTDKVETTQPELNFNQYNEQELEIVADILSGLMSPATLGIDLARKDNATAQREKEKITLITRDYLVDIQSIILKRLFILALKVKDYMINPNSKPRDFNITINYPDYANPSFENKLTYLLPAFVSSGMSAEQYVNELWGDALSEEERKREIATLESYKNAYQQIGGNTPYDNVMLE